MKDCRAQGWDIRWLAGWCVNPSPPTNKQLDQEKLFYLRISLFETLKQHKFDVICINYFDMFSTFKVVLYEKMISKFYFYCKY